MRNLKKVLALVLVLMLSLGIMATAAPISGVTAEDYGYAEARLLSKLGILVGIDDQGDVAGDMTLNRYTAATFAYRAKTAATNATVYVRDTQFPDVTAGIWASGYVNWATSQVPAILKGRLDGTFDGDAPVLLAEYCAILTRMLGLSNDDTNYPDGVVTIAQESGLLKNVTGVAAYDKLTRMQTIVMTYNALFAVYGTKVIADTGTGILTYREKMLISDVFGAEPYWAVVAGTSGSLANSTISKVGQVELMYLDYVNQSTLAPSTFLGNQVFDYDVNVDGLLFNKVRAWIMPGDTNTADELLSLETLATGNVVVSAKAGAFALNSTTSLFSVKVDGITYSNIDSVNAANYFNDTYSLGTVNYGAVSASMVNVLGPNNAPAADTMITLIKWSGTMGSAASGAFDAFIVEQPKTEQVIDVTTTYIRTNAATYYLKDGEDDKTVAYEGIAKNDWVYVQPCASIVNGARGIVNYMEKANVLSEVQYTYKTSAANPAFTLGGTAYVAALGADVTGLTLGNKYTIVLNSVGDIFKVVDPTAPAVSTKKFMFITGIANDYYAQTATYTGSSVTGLLPDGTTVTYKFLDPAAVEAAFGGTGNSFFDDVSGWKNAYARDIDDDLRLIEYKITSGKLEIVGFPLIGGQYDYSNNYIYTKSTKLLTRGNSVMASIGAAANATVMYYFTDTESFDGQNLKVAIGADIPTINVFAGNEIYYNIEGGTANKMSAGFIRDADVPTDTTGRVYTYGRLTSIGLAWEDGKAYYDLRVYSGFNNNETDRTVLKTALYASAGALFDGVLSGGGATFDTYKNKVVQLTIEKATGRVLAIEDVDSQAIPVLFKNTFTNSSIEFVDMSTVPETKVAYYPTDTSIIPTALRIGTPTYGGNISVLGSFNDIIASVAPYSYYGYIVMNGSYLVYAAQLENSSGVQTIGVKMDDPLALTYVYGTNPGYVASDISFADYNGNPITSGCSWTVVFDEGFASEIVVTDNITLLNSTIAGLDVGTYDVSVYGSAAGYTYGWYDYFDMTITKASVTLAQTATGDLTQAAVAAFTDEAAFLTARGLTAKYLGSNVGGVWSYFEDDATTSIGDFDDLQTAVATWSADASFVVKFTPNDTANFNTPTGAFTINVDTP